MSSVSSDRHLSTWAVTHTTSIRPGPVYLATSCCCHMHLSGAPNIWLPIRPLLQAFPPEPLEEAFSKLGHTFHTRGDLPKPWKEGHCPPSLPSDHHYGPQGQGGFLGCLGGQPRQVRAFLISFFDTATGCSREARVSTIRLRPRI